MKLPAFKLLKALITLREMSLLEAKNFLPKKYEDFRDWYPVAGLIRQGYLGNPFTGDTGGRMTEREIASMLYAQTLGSGHHKINNMMAINNAGTEENIRLYVTSKCDHYFADLHAKRIDRMVSALVAVLIGASIVIITVYIKEWLST